ncbi:MAG: hypothetical protein IJK42_08560 [Prevotella sp.]|nr:hypothetical protein [Prevotella sp.]
MKEFEQIGKRLPYREKEEYIEQLVDRCTEQAIGMKDAHRPTDKHRRMYWVAASAAAAVLLFAIVWPHLVSNPDTVAESEVVESPIDHFLNSLSDDEAQQLAYYEVEEIPEF